MSFLKVSEKITDHNKLAAVVKDYLVASGYFAVHRIFTDTHFSLKHKNGKWFMFEFNINDVKCFLCLSEPTQESKSSLYTIQGGMSKVTYPLLNLYLITTKTFVAVSAEIRNSVFRHMLVGRMESYTNQQDGEFVYSTYSYYNGSGYKTVALDSGDSYYRSQDSVHYYYAQGIIGHNVPSYSEIGNYVAYKGELIISGVGRGSKKKFISMPPTNVLRGSMNFNGRSPLNTHHLMYSPNGDNSFLIPVFYCNELATIAIDNLSPADIVLDDWIVFPVITRLTDIPSDEVSTGNLGVAFKFK